jgi:hypothetical protein
VSRGCGNWRAYAVGALVLALTASSCSAGAEHTARGDRPKTSPSTTTTVATTEPTAVKATTTTAVKVTTATTNPPTTAPRVTTTALAPTTVKVAATITTPATGPSSTVLPTSSAPPTTLVRHGPVTSPPLPPAGPGFVPGRVTAIGDSVMLDYAQPLSQEIPGIDIEAAVSRQWSAGEALVGQLKAEGRLGAVVIIGLGTNGPVTAADFNQMMTELHGASRVVFINVHVDKPWQGPVNSVLAAGVARYPRAVLADWYGLVSAHPGWLYSDGTHLPIDGSGAQALAALVAAKA